LGEIISGVMRGGSIGPNGIIGDDVKLVTDNNYFGVSTNDVYNKKIKNKGKF
jgi:hypothetical protein